MTYVEFRNKYNGKYIDYDGQYGAQCWDLGQKYFTECLGLPPSVLGGCGLVSNMLYPPKREVLDKYFDEVKLTEMQPGDVVIWTYGHIAIFDNWDGKDWHFFSQNYPKGSNCHIQIIYEDTPYAFRLKSKKPAITPNVQRDETKEQIYVKVPELRVRTTPSLNGEILGFASIGYYNVYDTKEADGYKWYQIADNNWVAYDSEWEDYYPVKDYKQLYEEALNEISKLNANIDILKKDIALMQDKIDKAIKDLS